MNPGIFGAVARRRPAVGVSYADHVLKAFESEPTFADFVEIPFELLLRSPTVLEKVAPLAPVVLHCASLSLAGNRAPASSLTNNLKHLARVTRTPWIGEHLAFVRCGESGDCGPDVAPQDSRRLRAEPTDYDIGYTVSPQMSPEIVERVVRAVDAFERELDVPLLLENSPLYFPMPGSTLSQVDFIGNICDARPSQRLLLDIVHLEITCLNMGLDPRSTMLELPLDRVDEIHISGFSTDLGVCWDNHSRAASESTFELLRIALQSCIPRAITLEYNWGERFPVEILAGDVSRVRQLVS